MSIFFSSRDFIFYNYPMNQFIPSLQTGVLFAPPPLTVAPKFPGAAMFASLMNALCPGFV